MEIEKTFRVDYSGKNPLTNAWPAAPRTFMTG